MQAHRGHAWVGIAERASYCMPCRRNCVLPAQLQGVTPLNDGRRRQHELNL
jgi:hypothetical protein